MYGRKGIFYGTVIETALTLTFTGVFYATILSILLSGASKEIESYYVTIIGTIQTFAGFAQVLSPFIFESKKKRKSLILILRGIYYFIQILVLPGIIVLPLSIDIKAILFISFILIATISESLGTPARSEWHLFSLPKENRNDYYSSLRLVTLILNAVLSLLLSIFMDYFKANSQALIGVLIMRGISIPFAIIVIKLFSRAKEPVYNEGKEKIKLKDIFTAPFQNKVFIIMVIIQMLYMAGNSFHSNFYNMYLLDGADISYTYLSICSVASIPCILLSIPFWNKAIRRFGWMRVLAVSMFLYSLCYVINVFVTKETQFMYIISNVYCQLISGGMGITLANLVFLYIPDKLKTACIAFFTAMSSLASVLATYLGGVFIKYTNDNVWNIFGLSIENRAYMCFINFSLLFIDVLIVFIFSIYEKKHFGVKGLFVGGQNESTK